MSQQNLEIARRSLTMWARAGEVDWSLVHEDVEVEDHDIIDVGEYRGRTSVELWLENWRTAWSEYHVEPEEFIGAGNDVVAVLRVTAKGRGSGITIDRQDAVVFEVRDEKIARLVRYKTAAEALKAVGLKE